MPHGLVAQATASLHHELSADPGQMDQEPYHVHHSGASTVQTSPGGTTAACSSCHHRSTRRCTSFFSSGSPADDHQIEASVRRVRRRQLQNHSGRTASSAASSSPTAFFDMDTLSMLSKMRKQMEQMVIEDDVNDQLDNDNTMDKEDLALGFFKAIITKASDTSKQILEEQTTAVTDHLKGLKKDLEEKKLQEAEEPEKLDIGRSAISFENDVMNSKAGKMGQQVLTWLKAKANDAKKLAGQATETDGYDKLKQAADMTKNTVMDFAQSILPPVVFDGVKKIPGGTTGLLDDLKKQLTETNHAAGETEEVKKANQEKTENLKAEVKKATALVLDIADRQIENLNKKMKGYISDTEQAGKRFLDEFKMVTIELKKAKEEYSELFYEIFGGEKNSKKLLSFILQGISAYAGYRALKAILVRLQAIRTNPMNMIETRMRPYTENEKTKRMGQWVNSYADEPSPVTWDSRKGIYKGSIDTIVGWSVDAKGEKEKTEEMVHNADSVLRDLARDKDRAFKAVKKAKRLAETARRLQQFEKELDYSQPLSKYCALNLTDTTPSTASSTSRGGPPPGKLAFCRQATNLFPLPGGSVEGSVGKALMEF
ncbi:unnamed protein product [Amoebophrya sp. A120]|nr:unnamed protein product [Amoebophrya sp. A120]|eukprot:GSA120T00023571001.1